MYISRNPGVEPASPRAVTANRSTRAGTVTRVSGVVVTLGIVSMLTDVSSESVAAILPLYATGALGLSTIAYGFIDGLYQGVSAVMRIGGGWAADRSDRPKWIAFTGYAVSAIAKIWLMFASGLGGIVAVVVVDRLGKGVRTAPRDALITASSNPSNLGRSFGVHRMLDTIGAAVGPLLAFLVLSLIPNGYSTVFVFSFAFAVAGVVILVLVVPGRRIVADRTAKTSDPFRWSSILSPRLRRLTLAAGVLGLLTVGDGFVYLCLQARSSFAAHWFPLLYVGTNIVFLLLAIPLGRLADRFGRGRTFVFGHCALLLAYACTAAPFGGVAPTVICLVLLGAFYASTDGVLAALAGEVSPPGATASGIASTQTVVALTRMISAIGFGVLWFALGRVPAMLVVAGALAVAIPTVFVMLRPLFAARERA